MSRAQFMPFWTGKGAKMAAPTTVREREGATGRRDGAIICGRSSRGGFPGGELSAGPAFSNADFGRVKKEGSNYNRSCLFYFLSSPSSGKSFCVMGQPRNKPLLCCPPSHACVRPRRVVVPVLASVLFESVALVLGRPSGRAWVCCFPSVLLFLTVLGAREVQKSGASNK